MEFFKAQGGSREKCQRKGPASGKGALRSRGVACLMPLTRNRNTQMRQFICSSQLANELLRLMEILKTDGACRRRLASDGGGRIEWVVNGANGERVVSSGREETPGGN